MITNNLVKTQKNDVKGAEEEILAFELHFLSSLINMYRIPPFYQS